MSPWKRTYWQKMRINLAILLFFGVGCASFSPAEQIMRSDKPRAYKYGFLQGCESGHAKAGNSSYKFFLNKKRYKKGSQYWLGWRKGYKLCRSQYDPEGRKWEEYPIP
jgi:hypothetical protein